MKIVIYGKTFEENFYTCIQDLFRKLQEYSINVYIYHPFYDFLRDEVNLKPEVAGLFNKYPELPDSIDYFFSIGGDGTFMETITYVRDSKIPVVGINSGRLGFLANISKEELSESLDDIFAGKYTLDERALLEFESPGKPFGDFNYALNEVTIQKIDATMITIHTFVNDELLNAYWADGLILSTPTGSTAYSMSVGGPIVIPDSHNFIISPIAPHNLTVRPVVIPDNNELRLRINGRTRKFLATLDFRSAEMESTAEIVVRRAGFQIAVLKLANHNYYSTLRSKLMWGADKRN